MDLIRWIIHLDLDAFFCAVEELRDPSLIGKPFAVGGLPGERGVVASCSYPARRYGIRSAMPMSKAIKLCPRLLVISSRHHSYSEMSRKVMGRIKEVTQEVEQISIDEAFLDVSDISKPPEVIARELQARIRNEFGLPCSLGVASNKLVAKIATDVGKKSNRSSEPPNALTFVSQGTEAEFLAPLPVDMLWGVGPKTTAKLADLDIHTIGQLASYPQKELIHQFGKSGQEMAQHALGIDSRPIITSYPAKSISQETTFIRDISKEGELISTLEELSKKVAHHLQRGHYSGVTIKLKLRWPDFTTLTRQTTLSHPTDDYSIIKSVVVNLFHKAWRPGKAIRLLGVGVSGLSSRPRQPSFWDTDVDKEKRLEDAIEELHKKFGDGVIKRGMAENTSDETY
jgi:DNA polymerase-4